MVKVGVFGPFMFGTSRERLLEWFRRTLATGYRMLWPNVETEVFLAAAASVTERVRISCQVMQVPARPPVLLAKRLASIDVVSGGRLVVGVGTGGRYEDYRAAGASMEHRWQQLDDHIETMRRVWRAELPWPDASMPVGPPPVQPGGPPIYTSASGPKALARAAKWADGWTGYYMHGDLSIMKRAVEEHLGAWEAAGRTTRPYMMHCLWFALADDGQRRLDSAGAHYIGTSRTHTDASRDPRVVYGGEFAASTPDGVRRVLDNSEAAGFDEVVFIPIADDLRDLDILEEVVANR
jgi:alkanesulfonate monooxygenase SsuD/methylene tetrahydromethanopterin reductase-like flavin-dependent oxidoreductase (luciferase family)